MTGTDRPVLVTGASGTVGGEVARQLAAGGFKLRVLVRSPEKAEGLPNEAEVAIGDFADTGSLARAVAGTRSVFMASFDHPDQLALQGNLIEAAKEAGVGMVARLSASSSAVDGPAALIRAHGEGDRQLAESGLGYCLLMPSWFHQNFLHYCPGGVIRLPVGDGRVPFIDVRDIAAVAVKALTEPGHSGQSYLLVGPELLTHTEVAEILSQATGKAFRFEDITAETWRQEAVAGGMSANYAEGLLEILDLVRTGESAISGGDVQRVTGRPPISLADFGRDYAEALVRQL